MSRRKLQVHKFHQFQVPSSLDQTIHWKCHGLNRAKCKDLGFFSVLCFQFISCVMIIFNFPCAVVPQCFLYHQDFSTPVFYSSGSAAVTRLISLSLLIRPVLVPSSLWHAGSFPLHSLYVTCFLLIRTLRICFLVYVFLLPCQFFVM